METEAQSDLRMRLARRIRARRDELGLSQQALADQASVHVNTVIRMEQGEFASRRSKTWTPVEEALGLTPRFFDHYLAGEIPDELESRYRNRTASADSGRPVDTIESALYQVFMASSPGTSLEEFDKIRRRVFDVLREAGVDVAARHDDSSSGIGTGE